VAISEIGKGPPDLPLRAASNFITYTHGRRIDIQLQFVRGIFNINPARKFPLFAKSCSQPNIGMRFLLTPGKDERNSIIGKSSLCIKI
jgi:hypothetical protein